MVLWSRVTRSGSGVNLKADFASLTIFALTKRCAMVVVHTSVLPEEEAFAGFIHCIILLSIYFMLSLAFITETVLGSKADKIPVFTEL